MKLLKFVPPWGDPFLPNFINLQPKVFGIGFHRTGTTSLARALRRIGYRVQRGFGYNKPNKKIRIPEPVTIDKVASVGISMAKFYDGFADNPWPLLYRELDEAFPGSKFILTIRDPQKWIESAVRHFGMNTGPRMDLIYETPGFRIAENRQAALDRFLRHNDDVQRYFEDRTSKFLVWDLESEPNWRNVCNFLGVPEPSTPFPHLNAWNEEKHRNLKLRLGDSPE